ncbi:hypothetical protein Ae201684P_017562 [Aphanomyces euteiches]|nr:hypothetical protein Ae201684P_017562 [Aphanomyces euteiches]
MVSCEKQQIVSTERPQIPIFDRVDMSNLRQLSESVVCSLPFVSLIAVTIIAVVALFLHGNRQIKRARVLLRQRRPSTADTIIIESPKSPA